MRRFDGLYRVIQNPVVRKRARSISIITGFLALVFGTMAGFGFPRAVFGANVSISGTVYQTNETSALTTGPTVRAKVNGAGDYSIAAAVAGTYTISNVTVVAGDVITVYLDGAVEKAATYTVGTASNMTGIDLYQDRLATRCDNTCSLTNANIDTWDKDNDTDIHATVSGVPPTILTVDNDWKLRVSANTFAPGGTVTMSTGGVNSYSGDVSIASSATLNMAGNALSISGSYSNSGTFTHGNNTTTFSATATGKTLAGTMTSTSAFYNLTFNGSGGAWTFNAAVEVANDYNGTNGSVTANGNNLTVTNDFTLANTAGVDYVAGTTTVTVTRHFTDSGDKFSAGTSTLALNGTGTMTIATNSVFNNVSLAYSSKTTTASVTIFIDGILTFNGGTVTGAGNEIKLRCSTTCTPVVFASATTISGSNSLVYTATANSAAFTIAAGNYGAWGDVYAASTFNDVTFGLAGDITHGANNRSITLRASGTGATFNSNNYSITAGEWKFGATSNCTGTTANWGSSTISFISTTNAITLGATNCGTHTLNMNSSNVSVKGAVTLVSGTGSISVSAGTSTLTWAHTSGTVTYSPNGQSLYNMTLNGSGGTVTPDAAVIVTNDLTMTAGTLNGTQNITVNGNVAGTAGIISLTGGTFEQRVSTDKNFGTTSGSTAWTFSSLTFSNSNGSDIPATITTQTGGTGGITVSSILLVGKAADTIETTLNAGNRTWTLSGTGGDPFQLLASPAGALTGATSTFTYTGVFAAGNTTIQSATYYNLTITTGGASAETYVLEGTTGTSNDLAVTFGTLDTTASNYALNVGRDLSLTNAASVVLIGNGSTITVGNDFNDTGNKFTEGTASTVNMTGTADNAGTLNSTSNMYNLQVGGSGKTITIGSSMNQVDGVMTLNGGSVAGSAWLNLAGTTSKTPLVFAAATTLTGSQFLTYRITGGTNVTFTIAGGNYGSWHIDVYTSGTNNSIYNLAGDVTTTDRMMLIAATAVTGTTFNTQNFAATASYIQFGDGSAGRDGGVTANLGSSTVALSSTSNSLSPASANNGTGHALNMQTSSVTVSGGVLFVNGTGAITVTPGTSTLTWIHTSGTATYAPNGQSLYNMTLNGSGGTVTPNAAVDIDNDLTMTAGTLNGTQNITVNGNVAGTAGIMSLTGGTFTQRAASSKNFGTTSGSTAWTFSNLTFSTSATAPCPTMIYTTQTGGSGGITVSGILLVGAAGDACSTTLNAGNRTWTLSGTGGDPFQILASPAGVLTGSTSTFTYTGINASGNTTIQSATYYNLTVNEPSNVETYVLEGTTSTSNDFTLTLGTVDTVSGSNHALSVTNDLTISGGSFTARNSTITVGRHWTYNSGATFTRGGSTVVLNGTGNIAGTASTQFENLSIGYATKTTTLTATTNRTDAFGTLTLNGGTVTSSATYALYLIKAGAGTYTPLVFSSATTLSGSSVTLLYRATVTGITINIAGGDYGTWYVDPYASAGNDNTWNLAGDVTTTGDFQPYAATGVTGMTVNTQNYNITAKKITLGNTGTNLGIVAFALGSSTITLSNGTGDAITVADVAATHTLNMGSASISVKGSVRFVNGSGAITVTPGTSTLTWTNTSGTLTYAPNGQSLYNLTLNGSGSTVTPNAAVTITNDLTMTDGTLNGTQNITVNGNVAGTAGIMSLTGGTFEQRITAAKNFGTTSGSTAWTFNSLTFSNGCVICSGNALIITTQTGGSGGITVSSVLSVGKAADGDPTALNAGNRTWTLSGTGGDPFQLLASPAGALTATTSTFSYTGTNASGNTTIQTATFYNLTTVHSGLGSETFVLEGATTASNDLTIGSSTVLDTVSGSNWGLTIGGNYSNSGTFTAQSGTVTFNATDTGNTLGGTLSGTSAFYNLTFNGSGGEWTPSAAVVVANDLTMTAGSLLGTQNVTVGNSGSDPDVTGNGTINLTGGTFTLGGQGTVSLGGNTAWTFNNLTFTPDYSAGTTLAANGTGGITIAGVFTIDATSDTLSYSAGSKTYTLSGTNGDPFVFTGIPTFTPETSTFTFTGNNSSGNTTVQSTTYNNLILNNASETYALEGTTAGVDVTVTAGTLALNGNSLTATDDLTVDGTLSGSSGVTVNGNVAGTGTVTLTGGTFAHTVAAAKDFGTTSGSNDWTFYNLTFSASAASTVTTQSGTGGITVSNVLTVESGGACDGAVVTLNAGGRTWTLSGTTGTPFAHECGTFTASTSTVSYTGNNAGGNTTVNSRPTYYNLTLNNASETYALGGTTTASNNLTISAGTLDVTAANYELRVGGTFSNSDGFTARAGKVILNGTSQTIAGSTTFYDLEKITGSATLTFTAGTTQTIGHQTTLKGTGAGALLSLRSSSSGTQWRFDPQGERDINFVDVQDSYNINAAHITTAYLTIYNSGNNTGWDFGSTSSGGGSGTRAPSNLTGEGLSTSSIIWRWSDNSTTETGFKVKNTSDETVCTVSTADVTSCTETGLSPNTAYLRYVVATTAGGQTGGSGVASASTLSTGPSASTVTSDKSTKTWYRKGSTRSGLRETGNEFTFTNTAGFTAGDGVGYFRYAFEPSSTHTWTGTESKWSSGTLTTTATQTSDAWYLHLKGYNAQDMENGTLTLGPYYYDNSAPTLSLAKIGKLTFNPYAARTTTTEQRPTLVGKLSEQGTINLLIEKRGFTKLGLGYGTYITATITTDENGNFSWTPTLEPGMYRVTLVGADRAGNESDALKFNLNVRSPEEATSQAPTEEELVPSVTPVPGVEEPELEGIPTTKPISLIKPPNLFWRYFFESLGEEWDSLTYPIKLAGFTIGKLAQQAAAGLVSQLQLAFSGLELDFSFDQRLGGFEPWYAVDFSQRLGGFPPLRDVLSTAMLPVATQYPQSVDRLLAIFSPVTNWTNTVASKFVSGAQSVSNSVGSVVLKVGERAQTVSDQVGFKIVEFGYRFVDERTIITDVEIAVLSSTSAKITWKTNHPATSKINYGTSTTYSEEAQSSTRVSEHEFLLENLTPNTQYFFEVMSQNKNYVYDANRAFKTPPQK